MGWQKNNFRAVLRATLPDAVDLMLPDAKGGRVLYAILALRNTIHRRMPDPVTTGRADGDPALHEMALMLERRSHGAIFDAFEGVGWTRYAGMRVSGDYLLLRPTTTVALMINDGIPILNSLLEMTPFGAGPSAIPDVEASLFPDQLRRYAADYLRVSHLLPREPRRP